MYTLVKEIVEMPIPFNMVVIVVFICTIGAVIGTIAKEARKFAAYRMELELKRDMIDRGLSSDEIQQVIQAGRDAKTPPRV